MVNWQRHLFLCLFWAASAALYGGVYSGGSGTALSPYLVHTPSDWQELRLTPADWGKSFRLTAHLDLTGVGVTPVGNSQTRFTGFFDGNGYTIRNVSIDLPDQTRVGLFGHLGALGRIERLGVVNAYVRGKGSVGALVGYNYGVVLKCFAWGRVLGSEWDVGGLVGSNIGGAIDACYAECSVTGASDYVGGLVGYSNGDQITNAYARGTVSGKGFVGGLLGLNDMGIVSDCYAAAKTNGQLDVGGLVGHNFEGFVAASFWDVDLSGQAVSDGGMGVTSTQMRTESLFLGAGWDFDAVWWMPVNASPRLQGTSFLTDPPPGDLSRDGVINLEDAVLFSKEWLRSGCSAPGWCNGADINTSGQVNSEDLFILYDNWLR